MLTTSCKTQLNSLSRSLTDPNNQSHSGCPDPLLWVENSKILLEAVSTRETWHSEYEAPCPFILAGEIRVTFTADRDPSPIVS